MPDSFELSEKPKYDAVWEKPAYRVRNHGVELWNDLWERALLPSVQHPIDLGCGNGALVRQWARTPMKRPVGVDWCARAIEGEPENWDARADFCVANLWGSEPVWSSLPVFDFGMCADVMEHIPEPRVDPVLERIRSLVDGMVAFKIANFPSNFGTGELHVCQQDYRWWMDRISAVGGRLSLQTFRIFDREEYVFLWETRR